MDPGEDGDGRLAIIAGSGLLPRLIAEDRRDRALPYLVITFGVPPDWVADHPHERHRFEKVGGLFAALRRAGVRQCVFAGAMDRPRLSLAALDGKALTVAFRVLGLLRGGDDAMLRGLGEIFEREGIRMRAPVDCLPAASLTVGAGLLGRHAPRSRDRADAERAHAILSALGAVDVGQAAVVAGGVCLGVEAIEGTDALLARIGTLPPSKRAHAPPPSGVLLKMPKPGQDRRYDLPAIGPRTVDGAAAVGLAGLVLEADGVQVLDRDAVRARADEAGLFIWCFTPSEFGSAV